MTKLFQLSPEVCGSFGESTGRVFGASGSQRPSRASSFYHVELILEQLCHDDLLELSPCFFMSAALASAIQESGIGGFEIEAVKVMPVEQLAEDISAARLVLPTIVRLVPLGTIHVHRQAMASEWSGDDIYEGSTGHLVVSERFMDILRLFTLDNCRKRELTVS